MSVRELASGRYHVERLLGYGGMAGVYLAQDRELERPVALKLLAEHLADDDAFRARFVREARLAARLSHPNIIQVYDTGEDDGRPFIVMEYVPGETLGQMLGRHGRLSPAEASAFARQAALGLQHAHDAGLIHRDIKPQNLLVRTDGVLKITDFGIARALEGSKLTQLGTVLGTAAYVPPEQAQGREVTAAADIYSLGAVLYEALTGRAPFEFVSLADLAEKQRDGRVVPVRDLTPSVPVELEALVMRCLARDPRFRPVSAQEIADGLTHAKSDERPTLVAATKVLPARTSRSVPGAGAWLWIAAAAALGAVALALGLLALGGSSSKKSPPPPTTPTVAPIPSGATPADEARNLARWLRRHSR